MTVLEYVDVLIVGGGLAGIGTACHLAARSPWASYAIIEARHTIGGTWDLFRYPGVRSDSDMFTLGYSFRPWEGDTSIVDGESILQYIKDTAVEARVDRHVRFRHRVTRVDWCSTESRWHVTVQQLDTGEVIEMACSFLVCCSGYYRYDRGYLPDFVGSEQFRGTVVHPQCWPPDLDCTRRRVVVIGSGATAVTLVPALAQTAAHVTMLQRSPSYILSLPRRDATAARLQRVLPRRLSGPVLRWYKALGTQAFYHLSRRRPGFVRGLLRRQAERQLPFGYDVDTHFTPRYDPWDQRLCVAPDGDFFRAIKAGAVSVVTDTVARFTPDGLLLGSGAELAADVVVTATGLEVQFLGGIELAVDGSPVDPASRLIYKGVMLEGVPNLAVAFGYANASWTLKCDLTGAYLCRLLNHMRATGQRQCLPMNRDGDVSTRPLLGLRSGYVLRSEDRLPKQGSKFPWQVNQSYFRDYRILQRGELEDDVLVFTNPPAPVGGGEVLSPEKAHAE